jgi:hypothetical protein
LANRYDPVGVRQNSKKRKERNTAEKAKRLAKKKAAEKKRKSLNLLI